VLRQVPDIPDHPGGDPHHHGVRRDIPGHHGAGPDQGALPHGDPCQDRGVAADRGPAADPDRLQDPVGLGAQLAGFIGGPRVAVVDEDGPVPDEDLVLQGHPLAQEGVRGDLAQASHRGVLLDLDEGPDPAVGPDGAPVQVDQFGMVDPGAGIDPALDDGHGGLRFRDSPG